jgi:hypothetical protein
MHTLLASPCLAAVGEYIPFFGMLIPITAMFVVVAGQYFKNQSRKMWHETARIALEKGQPVPLAPPTLSPAIEEALGKRLELENRPSTGRGDIKAGLILIAIAAGMYVSRNNFGGNSEGPHIFIFGGEIMGFIGLALLLNALITFLTTRKKSESTSSSLPPKA